jgi:hypothetical protein
MFHEYCGDKVGSLKQTAKSTAKDPPSSLEARTTKIKIRQIEISIQEEKEEGDAGSAASVSAKQPCIVRSWVVEGPFGPLLCIAGQAGCGGDKVGGPGVKLDQPTGIKLIRARRKLC